MCGGDFIEDRNGKKISLTALMFVRHHKAFDFADYIQINQFKPGKATLYITMKSYLGRVGQTCSPKMDTRFDSGFPASFFLIYPTSPLTSISRLSVSPSECLEVWLRRCTVEPTIRHTNLNLSLSADVSPL